MPARPKSRNLSIYLLKEHVTTSEQAIANADTLESHEFTIGEVAASLYIKPSFQNVPKWVSLFAGSANLAGLRNQSTSAVLLVPSSGRLFAITFGYGKSLLNPGAFEEGFGIRTALGLIKSDSIRSIDKRTFDAIAHLTKQQASKAASTTEFGLDVEQDLMQAVMGVPTDASLGKRVSGKDSLVLTIPCELASIPPLLSRMFGVYEQKLYKENFEHIDQIDEIGDKQLRASLDEELAERIRTGQLDKIWMAVPEIVDWTDFGSFGYSGRSTSMFEDLDLEEFLETLPDRTQVTIDTLRSRRVLMVGEASGQDITSWSVYRCLYAELSRGDETFLLTDGKWYRVNPDFMSRIQTKYDAIEIATLELPGYEDKSERAYNDRIARDDNQFALMDRKLISYGGGPNKVEFCDLYSLSRQIVHVKRYAGSSVLSHLFAQGTVSAQLFYTERVFREKTNELLPDTHKLSAPQERPRTTDYEVIFAIISAAEGPLRLPFFSMISLVNAVHRIEALGYPTHLLKVNAVTA